MRARTWVFAVMLSLPLVAPATALAQPPDSHALADEQFRQGREAINKGDFKRALELLRTSHSLEPGRGKLFNIAFCEEQLGLVASAFRDYQAVLPQLEASDERLAIVKQHLAQLGPKVPHLRIELAAGAPADTTVTLDGAAVTAGMLGTEMAVDAGPHVIVAAGGGREGRYPVTVVEGAPTRISVELPPAAGAKSPAPGTEEAAPAEAPERPLRWRIGWAAVGAGTVSLLVGAVTGGQAIGRHATLRSACLPSGACPPSQQSTLSAFHTFRDVSTGTVVAGLALAAAGVVLVVVPPREPQGQGAWLGTRIGAGTLGLEGGF